jgi:hypothetical protein
MDHATAARQKFATEYVAEIMSLTARLRNIYMTAVNDEPSLRSLAATDALNGNALANLTDLIYKIQEEV